MSQIVELLKTRGTVLLVENNPDDALLAELAFERANIRHTLMIVEDAFEATNYLKGKGRYADRKRFPFPKLVLLDLRMPGMSGFELLEQLRADPNCKDLPVTVLSGSDYLRDVTRAYQAGANSFLVKPSALAKFAAALKETTDFWLGKPTGIQPVYLQNGSEPAKATRPLPVGNADGK